MASSPWVTLSLGGLETQEASSLTVSSSEKRPFADWLTTLCRVVDCRVVTCCSGCSTLHKVNQIWNWLLAVRPSDLRFWIGSSSQFLTYFCNLLRTYIYRVFRQKLDTFGRLQLGRWPSYHSGHHLIGCRTSRSFFWGAARQGPTSFDRAIAFFLKKSGFFCKFISNSSLIFLGVYSNCIFGFVGQSGITWFFRLSF